MSQSIFATFYLKEVTGKSLDTYSTGLGVAAHVLQCTRYITIHSCMGELLCWVILSRSCKLILSPLLWFQNPARPPQRFTQAPKQCLDEIPLIILTKINHYVANLIINSISQPLRSDPSVHLP